MSENDEINSRHMESAMYTPRRKGSSKRPRKDITGKRFGKLVVDRFLRNEFGSSHWACRCDCGQMVELSSDLLRYRGSCGCSRSLYRNSEYVTWAGMKQRCHNPNCAGYDDYGGRGIIVCDRWRNSFPSFLEDMGQKPSGDHSIDRINNDGNYEPGNCRWATFDEQAKNKRPRRSKNRRPKVSVY